MAIDIGAQVANTVTNSTSSAGTFVPEIWSDEVIASYEKNLVLANLVKKMSMTGKKGDVIHVPAPVRGVAKEKGKNAAVTIQNNTEAEVTINLNKHFEYSRLIEDIAEVQALASLRQFYTGDAGYALAKQTDTHLFELAKSFGNGDGSSYVNTGVYYVDNSNGLSAYAADTVASNDTFTDAAFRDLVQKMDDNDVPMDDRVFVIPPSLRNEILGLETFRSHDFVDGSPVESGMIGDIYGTKVYVSNNCPVIEAAADNDAGGDIKGALFMHKDALALVEQQGIRSQTQYKQEFLGTLYTADTLYGTGVLRDDAAFMLAVNG